MHIFGVLSIEKKNQCALVLLGPALLRLTASPPHLFLISPSPTWADPCPHLGLPLGGAWQDLRVPGLPTPVWVLRCKSPGALHSIHFPQSPLSYEARETASTCVICEYIRLSAFALMLLRAGLAWAADRRFFTGKRFITSQCVWLIFILGQVNLSANFLTVFIDEEEL